MKYIISTILSTFILLGIALPGKAQTYTQLTNLPTIYIETFDQQPVVSETVYKYCKVVYVTPDRGTLTWDSVRVRGRGNTTWTLPKKPYRLKFAKKAKLLGKGFANAKDWILLANAGDKLLMRNGLTSYVGKLMKMPFVPSCQFVDLYFNGKYNGNYQITDEVEVHSKRLEIVEQDTVVTNPNTNITGGYLLEPEGLTDEGKLYFTTDNGCHIRIHSPSPDVINSKQFDYIKNYINTFETALYGSRFSNKFFGYRKYVDTVSVVNWYLVNEISANADGFWCSYIYKEKNDNRLYFGPLWDFDICYNNCSRQGDVTEKLAINFGYGSKVTIKGWFTRMWDDTWFKNTVSDRFQKLREEGLEQNMYHYIDSVAELIKASRIENYKKWNIRTKYYDEVYLFDTYEEYVDNIKTFIKEHNEYLSKEFLRRKGLVPTKDFVASANDYYKLYCKAYPAMVIAPDDTISGKETGVGLHKDNEGSPAQKWDIYKKEGNYFIVNVKSGLALCDTGTGENAQLRVVTLDETQTNQQWSFIPQSLGGYYNIKNTATGNVANNSEGMADEGNPICAAASEESNSTSANRMWKTTTFGKSQVSGVQDAVEEDYALAYSRSAHTLRFVSAEMSLSVFQARIYDLGGKCAGIFRSDDTFDTSSLPNGTYTVSWVSAGKRHSTKFLKN